MKYDITAAVTQVPSKRKHSWTISTNVYILREINKSDISPSSDLFCWLNMSGNMCIVLSPQIIVLIRDCAEAVAELLQVNYFNSDMAGAVIVMGWNIFDSRTILRDCQLESRRRVDTDMRIELMNTKKREGWGALGQYDIWYTLHEKRRGSSECVFCMNGEQSVQSENCSNLSEMLDRCRVILLPDSLCLVIQGKL